MQKFLIKSNGVRSQQTKTLRPFLCRYDETIAKSLIADQQESMDKIKTMKAS